MLSNTVSMLPDRVKICEICSKEYIIVSTMQRYCSYSCKCKAHYRRNGLKWVNKNKDRLKRYNREWHWKKHGKPVDVNLTCQWCKTEFKTTIKHRRFCAKECQKRARDERKKMDPVHQEKRRARSARWYYKDLYGNRQRSVEYCLKRLKTDPAFRIKLTLRNRVRDKLKRIMKGKPMTERSFFSIGCSLPELKTHFELKFRDGMSWDNYGKVWVVDHIKPLSKFNLLDKSERVAANNYTNLQPLLRKENDEKSDKYEEPMVKDIFDGQNHVLTTLTCQSPELS